MYAEERRRAVAELIRDRGRVEVAALAERFEVTPETVRRDLDDLERRGVLRRVHGGAMPVEPFRAEPAISERAGHMAEEKQRIAKVAVEHVPWGGSMLVDAGTTTGAFVAALPADGELTVVTNGLPIAMTLSSRPDLRLLLIGGRVRGVTLAEVGDWAQRTLGELSVDVAFVATNGLTADRGLSTHDVAEGAVKRAMVDAGRRVILLADHTKVGQEHFARFAELSSVDLLITDSDLPTDQQEALVTAGLEVACV